MNKKVLLFSTLFLLSVLLFPSLVSAVTIQSMVDAAVKTTLYIASGIVVILWVVAGLLLLMANGDPSKITTGKKALMGAIAGTVLVIVASSAITLVGGAFGL
jgi:hypothetical protein